MTLANLKITPAALKRIAHWICIAVFLLSLAVILIWLFGDKGMRIFLSSRMKFNSALALLASSLSLGLENRRPISKNLDRLAHSLALVPLLIGFFTLWKYITKMDIGLEERFVIDPGNTEALNSHGLISPNAAFCIFVLGISLIILDGKSWLNRLAQRFAIVSGCVAMFAVFGYLFEAQGLYKISSYIRMSHYTAIAVLLLSSQNLET